MVEAGARDRLELAAAADDVRSSVSRRRQAGAADGPQVVQTVVCAAWICALAFVGTAARGRSGSSARGMEPCPVRDPGADTGAGSRFRCRAATGVLLQAFGPPTSCRSAGERELGVRGLGLEERAEAVGRLRRREQVALGELAPQRGEEAELLVVLDALGDDRQVQRVGHADDGLDECWSRVS
jgi:hypothetical protein